MKNVIDAIENSWRAGESVGKIFRQISTYEIKKDEFTQTPDKQKDVIGEKL